MVKPASDTAISIALTANQWMRIMATLDDYARTCQEIGRVPPAKTSKAWSALLKALDAKGIFELIKQYPPPGSEMS